MRDPAPAPPFSLKTSLSNGSSFLKRIIENFHSVWKLPYAPLPAAHAPIHLLDERRPPTAPAAQLSSTLAHILLGAAVVWLAIQPPRTGDRPNPRPSHGPNLIPALKWLQNSDTGHLGIRGDSGGNNPLPPTVGELPPTARIALLPPHLPDGAEHPLSVPVTIQEADAPQITPLINDPGLPWMRDKNNSEGTGHNGIGNGDNQGMGDGPGDGAGVGDDPGRFGNVTSQVICRVCPDPLYSDEARKTKIQGSVLLSVLVGSDGRVHDIHILRGIGMGLDESAIQTVRTWQFIPAADAARHPIASWIKVETTFRLY
jgi:periplasmic protein TonB